MGPNRTPCCAAGNTEGPGGGAAGACWTRHPDRGRAQRRRQRRQRHLWATPGIKRQATQRRISDGDLYGFGLVRRARICQRLRSPGIDSEESIPPANVAWRASKTNRVVVPARNAGNRFLGSLKGLQIRAPIADWVLGIPARSPYLYTFSGAQESIPRLAESIPWGRFMGSLNVDLWWGQRARVCFV